MASHPHELVSQAASLGLHSLAITDRDGVYGIPKAYLAIREQREAQLTLCSEQLTLRQAQPKLCQDQRKLRLIVGSELALSGQAKGEKRRLFLLAKDRAGYGVMCRLLSASHEGREKGDAELGWARFVSILEKYKEEYGTSGLIAMPEEIPRNPNARLQLAEYHGALRDIFGRESFYFSLTRCLDGSDRERTEAALEWSRKFETPLLATNDVHMHRAEARRLQDVLTSIREGEPLKELGTKLFSNAERYLKSPRQMAELFSDLPDSILRTVEVAEQCRFSPGELRYHYPSEWIPEGMTAQAYLEELTLRIARELRFPAGIPDEIRRQLQHEFDLIRKMQFADYFLTVQDIVGFARSRGILCQGRGSAANSIVCYCLGVTAVGPELIGMLFERFISEERAEPPDIDVDFEHERREEVIQYIYAKYGRERAAMVANVICYRSKSSLREVSKAFALSPEEALQNPASARLIEEIIKDIKDTPRHLGIHSGGFTLSAVPLIETVPIEPARMEGRTVVQWDKDDLAALGLQKVDVLSLGMLSALRKMLTLVNQTRLAKNPSEPEWDLYSLPKEDPQTYEMIRAGETVGVFQIESRAQMGMLKRLLPENFYDLVVEIAIVRPGPIVGDMIHPYLRRRRKQEKVEYPLPELEPILGKTLGVPIFQEQVMKMAIVLAGFTPGEADELRRAINAWKSKGSIEKMGAKLRDGLLAKGLPAEFVDRIFKQIQGFSEYGFPESHSASFALLAYASSYFKRHYPAEFICALVNSQPMGFYSNSTLIEEARRSGVKVLPVDLNRSGWDCELEDGAIRVGLRVVKGLGKEAAKAVVCTRALRPFSGIIDFLSRTSLAPQALHNLAMGDAFAAFGLSQRESLWEILSYRLLTRPSGEETPQLGLFENLENASSSSTPVRFRELNSFQTIRSDHQVFGLSHRGHPMQALRGYFSKEVPPLTTGQARLATVGRIIKIAGMLIARQRPPNAKGTCFGTLEDEEGFLDLILHEEIFERDHDVFVNEPFLIVTGKIQRDLKATSLLVSKVESIARLIGDEELELPVQSKDFS